MTKRMLIDATHAEETRVVVLDGNRLEDFDVETSTKKQLKGNIYLAKIVRVEPSLQAAFVEYGGGRHGFLAFGEIHPDYYQIPVADRQRLLAMQAEEAREEEEAEEAAERALARQAQRGGRPPRNGGRERDLRVASAPASDEPATDAIMPTGPDDGFEPSAESSTLEADGSYDDTLVDPVDEAPEEAGGFVQSDDRSTDREHDPHDGRSASVQQPGASHHHDEPSASAAEHAHPDGHWETAAPSAIGVGQTSGAAPDDSDEDVREGRTAQPATIAPEIRFGSMEFGSGEGIHVPGAGGLEDALAEADAAAPGPEGAGEAGVEAASSEFREAFETPEPDSPPADLPPPETIGGETDTYDGAAEARARRASRLLRNYRIQEVIRRRQILLIQVVKEERGTKGAALTTYISLAGRFCVLMPNSPRGGGISRKITSGADRKRLKEITTELEIPRGMGLIVRTAGAARPKPEIKRDCEYLMRLWDDIREHTLKSVAPALIYEEASLIKRAIRDVYSRDVEEILVDGEQAWRAAHDFMRMLMPSHAKKVQLWSAVPGSAGQPLFSRQGVEAQLDGMLSPTVQLRSGGYLVIAQTEALVSIDVNSGRSTRERGIEETALKTNLEAADEVARQLRLRDLAGLIVIDFIDMESRKNNASVERRMKEALKNDRARIQLGHISHFGLMEMSRQRLRPSLAETSFATCPHCGGLGHVRSIESSAIHVLRSIEEEGAKQRAAHIVVYCAGSVALYLLNNKRERLGEIEARHAMVVHFTPDETMIAPAIRIERLLPQVPDAVRRIAAPVIPAVPAFQAETEEAFDDADEVFEETSDELGVEPRAIAGSDMAADADGAPRPGETAEEASRRRRRRRRRGGRRDQAANGPDVPGGAPETATSETDGYSPDTLADEATIPVVATFDAGPEGVLPDASSTGMADPVAAGSQPVIDPTEFDENGLPQPRGPRRSRRGGRRRRRFGEGEGEGTPGEANASDSGPSGNGTSPAYTPAPYSPSVYTGPTPADPFAGQLFDIFDLMDQPLDIPPVPPNARPPGDVEPHVERPVVAPSASATSATQPLESVSADSELVETGAPATRAEEALVGTDADETAPLEIEAAPVAVVDDALPGSGPNPATGEVHAPAVVTQATEPTAAVEVPARDVARSLPAGDHEHPTVSESAEAADASAANVSTLVLVTDTPAHAAALAAASSEPATTPAAEPVAVAEPAAKLASGPDPSVVQPVVIGKDAPAAPKRGWWRA